MDSMTIQPIALVFLGVLLLALVTVESGGCFLTRVVRGSVAANALQKSFFRAGHAHAAVLLVLGFAIIAVSGFTSLTGAWYWIGLLCVPAAALVMPAGFFLSVIGKDPQRPNRAIVLLWIGAASMVLGMGHLVFTIAGQSAIARYAPVGRLDAGFGWFTAAFSGGQLVGPLLAGLLLGSNLASSGSARLAAIDAALYLAAGIAAAAVPLLAIRRPGTRRPTAQQAAGEGAPAAPPVESALQILRRPGVAWNMLAAMALLGTIDILVAFLPLLGEERGVAPVAVGTLLAVRACASIASRLMLSQLLQRFSRYQLLVASLLGAGSALLFTPLLLGNFWLAALALAIGGFLLGLGQPLTMSLISQAVRPESRGAALALRLLGNRVGQVGFPLAAGLLAAPLGPAGAIWFACLVLGTAGAAKLVRPR